MWSESCMGKKKQSAYLYTVVNPGLVMTFQKYKCIIRIDSFLKHSSPLFNKKTKRMTRKGRENKRLKMHFIFSDEKLKPQTCQHCPQFCTGRKNRRCGLIPEEDSSLPYLTRFCGEPAPGCCGAPASAELGKCVFSSTELGIISRVPWPSWAIRILSILQCSCVKGVGEHATTGLALGEHKLHLLTKITALTAAGWASSCPTLHGHLSQQQVHIH